MSKLYTMFYDCKKFIHLKLHCSHIMHIKLSVLCVYTGTGKTALMAKLAHEVYKVQKQRNINRPVIVRFCGTSSGTMIVSFYILFNSIKSEQEVLLDWSWCVAVVVRYISWWEIT